MSNKYRTLIFSKWKLIRKYFMVDLENVVDKIKALRWPKTSILILKRLHFKKTLDFKFLFKGFYIEMSEFYFKILNDQRFDVGDRTQQTGTYFTISYRSECLTSIFKVDGSTNTIFMFVSLLELNLSMISSLIIVQLFQFIVHGNYQSNFKCMELGFAFLPKSPIQILFNNQMASKMLCAGLCNSNPSCRIFNYDYTSKQCKLFEGDLTTGNISTSIGSNSTVCHVDIQPELYTKTYRKNCSECTFNRYTMCTKNASTCQCPANSYWNGEKCILQLFENDTCNNVNACHQSLNLTCTTDCYGKFERCQIATQSLYTLASVTYFCQ